MTTRDLDLRILQMHLALEKLRVGDEKTVVPERFETPERYWCVMDFTKGSPEAALRNVAEQLVNNIARLKDHLKEWCSSAGKHFEGEDLINSNKAVAIIHDLWNTDKHARLNRPPRSGHRPMLADLRQALSLSTGPQAGGMVAFSLDPTSGKPRVQSSGGDSASLTIVGEIQDENGVRLGGFGETCEAAIAAWEAALSRAGVAIAKP